MIFRRKPKAAPVLPSVSSPALDAAREAVRATIRDAEARIDEILSRLREVDPKPEGTEK